MTLHFIPTEYPAGRIVAKSGGVAVGAVFPPVGAECKWRWRVWITPAGPAAEGAERSESAARNAVLAARRDWLRAAELKEEIAS